MEALNIHEERKKLAIAMYEKECLLFGSFLLSSGITINAYLDLIILFSHPQVLDFMCDVAHLTIRTNNLKVQNVCGVSYAGVPFAALIAHKLQAPLLMRFKEVSLRPSDIRIAGNIQKGSEVLVVEEVMCSATSILQTIKDIEDADLIVKDILVMVDLEQGGEANLSKMGYRLHSVLKLSELVSILYKVGLLNDKQMEEVRFGWKDVFAPNGDCITNTNLEKRSLLRYESRFAQLKSKMAQKLFQIIIRKKSNLCVDLSSPDFNSILKTADLIGPHICILSIHLDSLDIQDLGRFGELKKIAVKHDFLLLDDRKLSENGDALRLLLKRTLNYVDLVTVLPLTGENTLTEINNMPDILEKKGVIIVGSCFLQDSLINSSFERNIVKLTLQHCPSVMGFESLQNSDIPLPYIHVMQNIRSTSAVTNCNLVDSYYEENILTQKLAADVVMLSVDCDEKATNLVEKKRHISWLGYENRFCNVNGFHTENNK